jgi:hypothetical protein
MIDPLAFIAAHEAVDATRRTFETSRLARPAARGPGLRAVAARRLRAFADRIEPAADPASRWEIQMRARDFGT